MAKKRLHGKIGREKSGLGFFGGVMFLIFALYQYRGLLAWGVAISYVCILRSLYTLSGALDEAGYAVSPAPVRVSDTAAKRIYAGVMVLALLLGFCFFGSYPMDWKTVTASEKPEVQAVRQELLELGFPEHILDDLTEEDLRELSQDFPAPTRKTWLDIV